MGKIMNLFKRAGVISLALAFFVFIPVAYAANSPGLGTATSYSILAGSAVTNTGATTISGDVGISPGIGVPPHYSGFGTVTLGGSIHDGDSAALQAQADTAAAFTDLGSQTCDTTYAGTQDLVGLSLVPGVYCADAFELTGTLTLNGADTGVWIFKSASSIVTTGSTANIVFTGGGQPCNVWWRAVSSATFDVSSSFAGNVLADTSITFATGASLNGRALARTAEVTLDNNSITGPTCVVTPPGGTAGSGTVGSTASGSGAGTPGAPNTGVSSGVITVWWSITTVIVGTLSIAYLIRKKV